jgi:hypothetical protein
MVLFYFIYVKRSLEVILLLGLLVSMCGVQVESKTLKCCCQLVEMLVSSQSQQFKSSYNVLKT